MKRNEVKVEDCWAIEDLYASDDAWEADFAYEKEVELPKVKETVLNLTKTNQEDVEQLANHLLQYFLLMDEMNVRTSRLYRYANCMGDSDHTNTIYQDKKARLMAVLVALEEACSFEDPFLIQIGRERMEACYQCNAKLELYRLYIERTLTQSAHVLDEEQERLLSMLGDVGQTPYETFSLFIGADLKLSPVRDQKMKSHTMSVAKYTTYLESEDRTLRKNAFESLSDSFMEHRNTLASLLAGQVKMLSFYAKAKRYSSALEASLAPKEIGTEIYDNLIAAVHDNLPAMYRYVSLRKKLLGLEELHFYDLYVPLIDTTPESLGMTYTFEEAMELVLCAVEPLGADYVALMRKGFLERWVDRYENEGKQGGAYSSGGTGPDTHPLVLMNFTGNLNSVFTLAHEMGHALHSYLSNHNQPVVYSQYQIFVAEVASTCNEALLLQYLLKQTKEEETERKKYLINYWLEQFRTTLYRQTMFAEFEQMIGARYEKGESLTADALCTLYRELDCLYYGPEFVVDEKATIEWARIPHFYYDYYVYQYATGYSAAIALSERILVGYEKEGANSQNALDYLAFLKGGSSKTPIELLKIAGVDMASKEPVDAALHRFAQLVDQLSMMV